MKIYKIKVNGKSYKVELEAIEEVASTSTPVIKEEKKEVKVSTGEGVEVLAPIQGNVVDVKVKVGDSVKKGQTIVIIEAMKLENEVSSTAEGVVSEILVSKGQSVTAKQVIIKVK